MISPIYPKLLDRLRRLEIEISIPCRHGWRWPHCDRDDEGSHTSEGRDGILRATDGTRVLLETDFCYCGAARRIDLPTDVLRVGRRATDMVLRRPVLRGGRGQPDRLRR